MIRDEFRTTLGGPAFRTVVIIWAALAASVLMYILVAFQITAKAESSGAADPVILYALAGVAVCMAVTTFALRLVLLGDERLLSPPSGRAPATPGVPAPESAEESLALAAVERYRTGLIVLWALSESVALLGLVAAIVGRRFAVIVPFAAVSLALQIVHRPARGRWDELIEMAARGGR